MPFEDGEAIRNHFHETVKDMTDGLMAQHTYLGSAVRHAFSKMLGPFDVPRSMRQTCPIRIASVNSSSIYGARHLSALLPLRHSGCC